LGKSIYPLVCVFTNQYYCHNKPYLKPWDACCKKVCGTQTLEKRTQTLMVDKRKG
jgi:hypothetical protein